MAAKKTAKKAPAKKTPAKKEIDPDILGKCAVMVKHGKSHEAVAELVESAKITSARAHKIVYEMQHSGK